MGKAASRLDKAALIIVLIAAVLRWFQPGLWGTWVDELSMLGSATDLVQYGRMVWLGNPSTFSGLAAHSPFSIYVTALPLLLRDDPAFARAFYGLLGILTVWLLYQMVQRYYGQTAAIFAGLLVAVAPIPVFWSRFVWNPNVAPVLIVLWLWTGLHGYHDGKRWAQAAHWLFLSLMIQAQTALVFMGPVSLFLVVRYLWLEPKLRRQTIVTVIAAGLVALVLAIPWMIGLIGVARGWWYVPIGTGNTFEPGIRFNLPSWQRITQNFAMLTSSSTFRVMTLNVVDDHANWWPRPSINIIFNLQAVIILIGAVALGVYSRLQRERFPYLLLIIVLIWPLAFLILDATRTIPYFYMQPMVFVAPIIFGIVFAWLWQRWRWTALIAAGFLLVQVWMTVSLIDWYRRGDNAMSVSEVQHMLADWQKIGGEIVLLEVPPADESHLATTEWELFWKILDEQFPLRTVFKTHAFPIAPTGEILASVASVDVIPAFLGEGSEIDLNKRIFRYVHVTPDSLPALRFVPEQYDTVSSVLRMVGVVADEPQAGVLWPIMLIWNPLQPEDNQYQFSVRLMDEAGNGYGQVDGETLQRNLWREGDTVLTRLMLPVIDTLPENADLRLQIIVYTLPDIHNLSVLDEAGNPVGDIMPLVEVK